MSTIKSSTTSTTAYQVVADTTGTLVFQTGATPTTAMTLGSDQSVTFAGAVSLSGNQTTTGNLTVNGNTTLGDASTDTVLMTGAPSIGGAGYGMGMGFRNRIINGAMMIDQRNAGASVTPTDGGFDVDRWRFQLSQSSKLSAQQNAGSVTPPAGFKNYLGITSLSAYSSVSTDYFWVAQFIEGFNTADLGFGSSSASTVTVSFWVRSSLTGAFSGALVNADSNRSYPFSYTISAANTWEQKSVSIAGDQSGTWVGATSGNGLGVYFNLGTGSNRQGTANAWAAADYRGGVTGSVSVVGTNGATFYITGVQLEKGSTATAFDYRPYGTELVLCERYYQRIAGFNCATGSSLTACGSAVMYKTEMRSSPTVGITAPLQVTRYGVADFTQSSASVEIAASGVRVNTLAVSLNFANFTNLPADSSVPSIVTGGIVTLSAEL